VRECPTPAVVTVAFIPIFVDCIRRYSFLLDSTLSSGSGILLPAGSQARHFGSPGARVHPPSRPNSAGGRRARKVRFAPCPDILFFEKLSPPCSVGRVSNSLGPLDKPILFGPSAIIKSVLGSGRHYSHPIPTSVPAGSFDLPESPYPSNRSPVFHQHVAQESPGQNPWQLINKRFWWRKEKKIPTPQPPSQG
jgi:hypothetical protein